MSYQKQKSRKPEAATDPKFSKSTNKGILKVENIEPVEETTESVEINPSIGRKRLQQNKKGKEKAASTSKSPRQEKEKHTLEQDLVNRVSNDADIVIFLNSDQNPMNSDQNPLNYIESEEQEDDEEEDYDAESDENGDHIGPSRDAQKPSPNSCTVLCTPLGPTKVKIEDKVAEKNGGVDDAETKNPVATLQLYVGRRCLIFQIKHADEIPSSLVEFLGDPDFTFVGDGIGEDVKKLDDDYDLEVEVVFDLRCLDADRYNSKELKNAGLMGLAGIVLNYGDTQKKPRHVTMSNREDYLLSLDQIKYACVDAYVSFQIGKELI
ncbi:hypothetical protein C5167_010377 [Papaver somniferum]|uniref:3'-5' exonuclease domain-containing protein n=1 Tax=Papaver somniferum TaxID=3469 RepID=A0A4Y7K2X7_PAPSO|nr:hypothetical protein C5167_010377 [Papaver somniferum]